MATPPRSPRFDFLALVVGTLGTGGLIIGLGEALLHVSQANTSPDTGATAATMSDAFGFVAGASLGMLVGCALTAFLCRRGPRIATGIVVGFLAWLAIFMPLGGWDGALFIGIPLAVTGVVGAIVGGELSAARERRRQGAAPQVTSA